MDRLFPLSRWGTAVGGDLLLAAVLTLVMAAAAALDGPATLSGRVGATVAAGGLLVLAHRRRRPATAVAVVILVTVTEVVASPQASTAPAFLAIMVATYSLGAYASTWPLVAGLALATAGVATAQYLGPSQGYSHASADLFLVASLVLAPGVVGGVAGARDRLGRRLDAGTERLRAARDERIAEELARERRRAFAALKVLLGGLEETRRHAAVAGLADVTALERIARDLLTRMRTLVGELRAPSADDRRPIREVAELRTQVREALAAANLPDTDWSGLRPAGRWTLVAPRWRDAAPTAWVRRHPLTCAVICLAVTLAYTAAAARPDPFDGLAPCGILVVAPFLLGVACPIHRALAGLALCLLGCAGLGLAAPAAPITAPEASGAVAVIVGCWAAGRVLRGGAEALAARARATIAVAEENRKKTAAALGEQRARLARDLHDAAGHMMTVIVLQAAAARRVWETRPDLAAEHVAVLRRTLAEALGELRPLLLSLTLADVPATAGLGGLPALAGRARGCGLRVALDVDLGAGTRALTADIAPDLHHAPLPRAVGTAVYRIVQEALTNAARHAPGAFVRVRITRTEQALAVHVSNTRPADRPALSTSAGHGLGGMAERSAACGGTFAAGPRPGGGFDVRAVFPLEEVT
ncbi:histidine kinase [Microbispora hainanensis]|uniref:histidine kinase n=1 Tax=Microbispora hainanensis TaxID=568844 RepID=A0A544YNY7_9ACTN|nr:histidine kinase [Microbispora hainanensis]TQS18479.1 hypothetical protein FLX08_24380 [Microbispora hainanensis]